MGYHHNSGRDSHHDLNRGFQRRHKRRPRYAIIDDRPFMPFRLADKPPKVPRSYPYPEDIIKEIKNFDFVNITYEAVSKLTNVFMRYHKKEHPDIYIGQYGIVNYGFAPQALLPGSLNPENAAAPRDHSASDLLKNFTFINAKDKNPGAPRLALALGRLTAQHHNPDRVSQSHWIVFLDQTRLLWACYAYGIDDDDIQLDEEGSPGPYSTISDSAFGTKRENGQKVVFLGALEEIEFAMNKELKNVKVHELDWSTSSLSDEQKSAMKVNISKTKKEPVIKEENAEMKEFGTREPDLLIKGEEETKDIPPRASTSEDVPDEVMDALQGVDVTPTGSSA